jgi:hypothetical protein
VLSLELFDPHNLKLIEPRITLAQLNFSSFLTLFVGHL